MAKEKGNPEEIKSKLLLAWNEYGETALHVAAGGSVVVMEKLFFFKESQINDDEFKNATCPTHLILFDLIIQIICGEYRSLSSSVCNYTRI